MYFQLGYLRFDRSREKIRRHSLPHTSRTPAVQSYSIYIYVRLIFPLCFSGGLLFNLIVYMCPSDLPPQYIYVSIRSSTLVYICVRLIFHLCFNVVLLFNLIIYVCVRLIFPLSIYICSSDLPPLFQQRPVVQSYSIYVSV